MAGHKSMLCVLRTLLHSVHQSRSSSCSPTRVLGTELREPRNGNLEGWELRCSLSAFHGGQPLVIWVLVSDADDPELGTGLAPELETHAETHLVPQCLNLAGHSQCG